MAEIGVGRCRKWATHAVTHSCCPWWINGRGSLDLGPRGCSQRGAGSNFGPISASSRLGALLAALAPSAGSLTAALGRTENTSTGSKQHRARQKGHPAPLRCRTEADMWHWELVLVLMACWVVSGCILPYKLRGFKKSFQKAFDCPAPVCSR